MLTAALPRWQQGWLAWFALAPLLLTLRNRHAAAGFKLGLICGLAHYMSLCYWLVYTMHTYGHLPLYLSLPVLFLASGYLSLYPAVFAAALAGLPIRPGWLLVAAPTVWVSLEYMRAHLLLPFPWELLGYSQTPYWYLVQFADVTGVYGLSLLVAAANAALLLGWLHIRRLDWQGKQPSRQQAGAALAIVAALVVSAAAYGHWRVARIDRQMAQADHVRTAVIQGNIDQAVKWNASFQSATVDTYLRLSAAAGRQHPDLIVWPETAAPFYFTYRARLTQTVLDGVRAVGADFLIGSPTVARTDGSIAYYNSAYLINRAGVIAGRYDKYRLVPFGEYVPYKEWLPFIGKMVEQVGDFKAGERDRVLDWRDRKLGVQICYEIIFPNLSRLLTANGANLLINLTNDAWYGRSSAPYQHFSMARMRAVENRRAVVRAANTGISGIIDPVGRVMVKSRLFEEAAIDDTVPLMTDLSIYSQWGDWLPAGCAAATAIGLLAVIFGRYRRRRLNAA